VSIVQDRAVSERVLANHRYQRKTGEADEEESKDTEDTAIFQKYDK
jgi:hypothetical protein